MNNFFKRTLSGIIFIAIIIVSILYNPLAFAIVFGTISFFATMEFHKITNTDKNIEVSRLWASMGSVLLFILTFLFTSVGYTFSIFSIYGLFLLVSFFIELFAKKKYPINTWAYLAFGQLYIALPFSLLLCILYFNNYQPLLLLAIFITIWVNDTGAYLVGVSIGKHKLFERISPKKSWEGFLGGALFALISGYVFSLLIPNIGLVHWLIISEIVVISGTLGDLSESLLKRSLSIKDSGNLIPGHGGILDRFDSMLMAAPAVLIYLSLVIK